MSSKGCLVLLEEDKCSVSHIKFAGDLIQDLAYGSIKKGILEDLIQWNKDEGIYREIIDKEEVEKCHRFDIEAVGNDCDWQIYLFMKKIDDENYDTIIRQVCWVDEYGDSRNTYC